MVLVVAALTLITVGLALPVVLRDDGSKPVAVCEKRRQERFIRRGGRG